MGKLARTLVRATWFSFLAVALVVPLHARGDEPPEIQLWQIRGLSRAYDDLDPQVHIKATRLLATYISEWFSFPKDETASEGILNEVRELVPKILKLLEDSDSEVRSSVISALGNMGSAAKDAVPQLTRLLEDQDPQVRGRAAEALKSMGSAAMAWLLSQRCLTDARTGIPLCPSEGRRLWCGLPRDARVAKAPV
ncbi:MAG: HEAT repeat domain-containing protein [Planctomycetota bacterium]|jgi:hypothetical protein